MSFRNSELQESYEYFPYKLDGTLIYDVANTERQEKAAYTFTVDNTSETNPIDWYNAYFEVNFKLVTLANSAVGITVGVNTDNSGDRDCTTTNGHTFIKSIQVSCDGTTVYNNQNANEASNVLSLLTNEQSYVDKIGGDQFFYLDTSTGTTEARAAQPLYNAGYGRRKILTDAATVNKISIPLNIYSYFASFKDNIQPNTKTTIVIDLERDNNIIFRIANAPDSKVIITKLRLWCPKIKFNGAGAKLYLENYLKPKKWTFLNETIKSLQTNAISGSFRISVGVSKPRHVFIWVVPAASYNSQERNIFTFKTFSIGTNNRYFSNASLLVNGSTQYPKMVFKTEEESRLFRALMSYNHVYNDKFSNPIIDRANFRNLFGIIYFDLRKQPHDEKNGTVTLDFNYDLNGDNPTNVRINALVLNEKEVVLYTDSGKLMLKV